MLQSTIWDNEAKQFGGRLCEFTRLPVQVERSQTDGIVMRFFGSSACSKVPDSGPSTDCATLLLSVSIV